MAGMDPVTGLPWLGTDTTSNAVTAVPTAAQQASFDTAFAQAQVGMNGSASNSTDTTPTHLLLYSMFQRTVSDLMAEVDRVRQDAADDD